MSDDQFNVEVKFELPTDADGFFRRECPSCGGQFKAFGHDEGESDDVQMHHCPLCGAEREADNSEWLTADQQEYIEAAGTREALKMLNAELPAILKKASSQHVKFEQMGHLDIGGLPDELVEPTDMSIVAPPCHENEPVKVPDDLAGPFFCMACGQRFAV